MGYFDIVKFFALYLAHLLTGQYFRVLFTKPIGIALLFVFVGIAFAVLIFARAVLFLFG